jgi:hypothetical protein
VQPEHVARCPQGNGQGDEAGDAVAEQRMHGEQADWRHWGRQVAERLRQLRRWSEADETAIQHELEHGGAVRRTVQGQPGDGGCGVQIGEAVAVK